MGITIESYRANIGIFNNKPSHTKIRLKTTNTHHQCIFNKNLKIYTLLCIFFFIIQSNNYSQTQQAHHNKLTHSINGNIKHNNIKIAHFNKGNSKFDNKIDDIHYIIDKHKPLIFQYRKPTTVTQTKQSYVTTTLKYVTLKLVTILLDKFFQYTIH